MMVSVAAQLKEAREALVPVAGELAALEARLLAQAAWGMTQEVLVKDTARPVDAAKVEALTALVKRRAAHEPIAQILGHKHFWKDRFIVSRDVLTPRADSETILETVLQLRPDTAQPYRILDLGTGSGCLLLSLLREYPNATGLGIDRSTAALAVAEENATQLNLSARASFLASDWCNALDNTHVFDIIVANPPYIPTRDIATLDKDVRAYEPALALDGGNDGLDAYRAILAQLGVHLALGAVIVCEIGIGQARVVGTIAREEKLNVTLVAKDLAGTERVVALTQPSIVGEEL